MYICKKLRYEAKNRTTEAKIQSFVRCVGRNARDSAGRYLASQVGTKQAQFRGYSKNPAAISGNQSRLAAARLRTDVSRRSYRFGA